MNLDQRFFHPMRMVSQMAQASSGIQAMDTLAEKLLAMPPLSDPQIPDLNRHMHDLKSNMHFYVGMLTQEMGQVYASVENFHSHAQRALQQVHSMVSKAPKPNDEATVDRIRGLAKALESEALQGSQAIHTLNGALEHFSDQVETTTRLLITDQHAAQALVSADQSRVNSLNSKISSLRSKVSRLKKKEIWCGILTIGICTAVMEAEHDVEKAQHDLKAAQDALTGANAELLHLEAVTSSLSGLSSNALNVVQFSTGLLKGWQTVDADLGEIQSAKLPTQAPLIFLQAGFERIAKDWETLAKAVKALRT